MTGLQLVDRWRQFVTQYLVCTPAQSLVLTLWAMHTWVYLHFGATPYLSIVAPTKRGGKTTALDLLALLSRNAEKFATVPMKTVVRMIEANDGAITILIDEAEKLSGRGLSLGDTRTMLATGYQRGAMHAVAVGQGFAKFRTYAPKAFASIGDLHPILLDRSILFDLERGKPTLLMTNNEERARSEASDLVAAFAAWAKSQERIPFVDPTWLTSSRDRQIWTPLFSLAALLDIGKHATDELVAFSVDASQLKAKYLDDPRVYHSSAAEQDAEDRAMSERLLRDVASLIDGGTFGAERNVHTATLINALRSIPVAPWRSWHGEGLNETTLAAFLSIHGVPTNQTVWTGSGRKNRVAAKGYKIADLRAAAAKLPKD